MPHDARPNGEHVFKLLVTGPFAAGKTSLIQAVSQTPVVETDVHTTGGEVAAHGLAQRIGIVRAVT